MAEFPGRVSTRTSTPASGGEGLPGLRLAADGAFLRSAPGLLMLLQTLVIFNAAATLLYITAFITCSASVKQTSWLVWEYNRRAAASFFACVTMIAYGASTFLSYQAWKGVGSNAATSQVTNHA